MTPLTRHVGTRAWIMNAKRLLGVFCWSSKVLSKHDFNLNFCPTEKPGAQNNHC